MRGRPRHADARPVVLGRGRPPAHRRDHGRGGLSRTQTPSRSTPRLYDAVLTGYLEAVPAGLLSRDERAALYVAGALVTYEQGLRFLTDWLAGDRYYRTTRPKQNLDRARAQLRLLSTMPGPGAIRIRAT